MKLILLLLLFSAHAFAAVKSTSITGGSGGGGGDASAANQTTEIAKLTSIISTLSTPSQDRTTAAAPNACRLTDGTSFLSALPVTGTFFQSTQPVSGTFWQSTQPVSIASMPSTPVTGTFWQATQPVSIASMPSTAVTNAGTFAVQAALNAETTKVIGTVNVAASQSIAVTQASASSLNATVAQSGTWTVQPGNTANTTAWKVDGSAVTQPVSGTVTVTPPTLTKGTQGATGFSTQELHDAGRNQTNYFMSIPVVTTTTDALMSLTGYKAGAAVTATTTPAVVTTGKTYRVTKIVMTYVAIATAGTAKFTLRANTGGVVAIGSPAVVVWVIGGPSATAGVSQTVDIAVPEGMEFAAGTGVGVSMVGLGATQTAAAVGFGQISIEGYEY